MNHTTLSCTLNVDKAKFERAKALLEYDDLYNCPSELNAKQHDSISIGTAKFDNGDEITIDICSGQINYYDNIVLTNDKFGKIVDFEPSFELETNMTFEFTTGDEEYTYQITLNLI